jgi:aminocarboxymuconate-semialdehyde decarboxylase
MLYRCGCTRPVAQTSTTRIDGGIDLHCHLFTPEVMRLVEGRPEVAAMLGAMPRLMGEASWAHNVALERETATRLADPKERLADMDLMGVAVQVVSPAPTQYHYWADADLSERIVAVQNDHIARLCSEHPGRFLGLGAISMQHPELAERQLTDLLSRGFKGVELSSRINDDELVHPRFERFWAIASEANAVVFIHPLGSTLGTRTADHYLANILGQPLETTIALSHLIFSGFLDRHPGIRFVAAHGGGFLPGFIGRSNHGRAVRPEARASALPPSDYLSRIWFDTVVHSPHVLANLIDVAGVSQIVMGSDYPYDMGEYRLGDLLADTANLSPQDRAAIVSGNAKRLLGLDAVSQDATRPKQESGAA